MYREEVDVANHDIVDGEVVDGERVRAARFLGFEGY
jgi:hypothetical protein